MNRREFPGGPWVRIYSFMAENMGSVLGEELRSLKLYGKPSKKKKKDEQEQRCGVKCYVTDRGRRAVQMGESGKISKTLLSNVWILDSEMLTLVTMQ